MFLRCAFAFALLSLSACGGGSDETSKTDPLSAFDWQRDQDAVLANNHARILDAFTAAAANVPRFGSVTQSSDQGADSASITFDGRNPTLTVARAEAPGIELDGGTDLVRSSGVYGNSPIPGQVIGDWTLFDAGEDSVSVSYSLVSWDRDDPTDYLAAGYWIH